MNGMAKWEPTAKEFYVEQTGVVADALQEALVQDYDGVIRIAPAIPPGWDFEGSVYVRGKTKVDVQMRNGAVTTVVIEAGTTGPIRIAQSVAGQAGGCDRRQKRLENRCCRAADRVCGNCRDELPGRESRRTWREEGFRAGERHARECGKEAWAGSDWAYSATDDEVRDAQPCCVTKCIE